MGKAKPDDFDGKSTALTVVAPVPDKKATTGSKTMYLPEYADLCISLARKGMFPAEWAAKIGVSRRTLYNWAAAYPDFADACERAHTQCQAWWEKTYRDSIKDTAIRQSMIKNVMTRRFGEDWFLNTTPDARHPRRATDQPKEIENVDREREEAEKSTDRLPTHQMDRAALIAEIEEMRVSLTKEDGE